MTTSKRSLERIAELCNRSRKLDQELALLKSLGEQEGIFERLQSYVRDLLRHLG